jgi:hypothetical protein
MEEEFGERYLILLVSYNVEQNCKTVWPNDLMVLRMSSRFQEMSQTNREKL